jgi:hypothetical protein
MKRTNLLREGYDLTVLGLCSGLIRARPRQELRNCETEEEDQGDTTNSPQQGFRSAAEQRASEREPGHSSARPDGRSGQHGSALACVKEMDATTHLTERNDLTVLGLGSSLNA